MRSSEQMERQIPDKKLFVTANTTVPLWKRNVFVNPAATTTITMPNVSEAEGRKFSVRLTGGTSVRTVIDYTDGTSSGFTTAIVTTGVDVEFESTGIEWVLTRAE